MQDIQLYSVNLVLAAMLAVALYTDIVRGKVYNKLTVPCIILGLALNTVFGGLDGLLNSIGGIGLGFAVLVIISLLRLMGGGDAKLLLAVGSLKGAVFLCWTMLFMALAGGILAIAFLLYKRLLKATVSDIGARSFGRLILRAPIEMMPTLRAGRLPYSVAIAAGVVVAIIRTASGAA